MIKNFLLSPGPRDTRVSLGLLVLRLGIGAFIAIGHGLPKVQNWGPYLEKWKSPDFVPLSWMSSPVSLGAIIFAELICGSLIFLGFFTRPAATILGLAMSVAAFYHHASDPFFMAGGAAKEPALLYLIPCLALLIIGGGRFSLDAALYKEKRRWGR